MPPMWVLLCDWRKLLYLTHLNPVPLQMMGCGRAVLAAGRMNTAEMLDALLPSADSLTLPSLEAFNNQVF